MSVTPLYRPLFGERLLAVDPKIARFVDSDWLRRLNLYTGRALSEGALIAEQTGRAGRLATRGQMVSPGVVSGLEVALGTVDVPQAGGLAPRTVPAFHVAAGFGIGVSGEDVFLPSAMVVPVQDVRVYAPADAVNASGFGSGTLGAASDPNSSAVLRRLGARLGDFAAKKVAIPHAGILLLQPILVEVSGKPDLSSDPCQIDPSEDAFLDFQIVDGCRLILYAWPTDWLSLPTQAPLRNQMAYAIFGRELQRNEGEPLPWEEVGIPVGLALFDDTFQCQFVDRYAVVRAGGAPKRRTVIFTEDNPFVWQARMQQFAEHLADLAQNVNSVSDLASQFQFAPPAGLLPKEAVDARAGSSKFFPAYYSVIASPIPLEQVDASLRASAGLAPFDLYTPSSVEILVPVPQNVFDPGLLIVEQPDPAFQLEVDRTTAVRLDALQRRTELYTKADALFKALRGKNAPSLLAVVDPDRMDGEPQNPASATELEASYGTTKQAAGGFVSSDLAGVKTKWAGTPLAGDLPPLDDIGLEGVIKDFSHRASQADDTVDLGFLRANSDIYRFRQLMLNNVAATRLATSPALAQIAQGESAAATRDDLEKFLTAAKAKELPTPAAAPTDSNPNVTNSVITHTNAFVTGTLASARIASVTGLRTSGAVKTTSVTTVVAKTPISALVSAQTQERVVFNRSADVGTVLGASPITGDALQNFRTISIAQRLQDPPATEARNYALAARADAIQAVLALSVQKIINMDDIPIPGIVETQNAAVVQRTFGDLKVQANKDRILSGLMNNVFDPLPANSAEAEVFANGVKMVEATISTMRAVEARIALYRQAAADFQAAVANINTALGQLDVRLKNVTDLVASARQDVATTLALLADEMARVANLNQRRDAVISAHVKFVAYVRPRRANTVHEVPTRYLDPGLVASPVPACLAAHEDIPPEITSLIKLYRDAPAAWFPSLLAEVEKINRLDHLRQAIQISQLRAQQNLALLPYTIDAPAASPGRLASMIRTSYTAQQQTIAAYRNARAQFDLSLIVERTWQETLQFAHRQLSVGDLLDAEHGKAAVAGTAANEMDNLGRVATCLSQRAGEVDPIVRLAWAEAIGQYDGPVNLRDLGNLPRWNQVAFLTRRELQTLADWLYGQIDATDSAAVNAIGELIRVAILLASHAPVNRLITGSLAQPAPVSPGGILHIQVDHTLVSVGMQVLVYRQSSVVARGVVEDLGTGAASARVLEALDTSGNLDQGAAVHFVSAGSPQFQARALKAGVLS